MCCSWNNRAAGGVGPLPRCQVARTSYSLALHFDVASPTTRAFSVSPCPPRHAVERMKRDSSVTFGTSHTGTAENGAKEPPEGSDSFGFACSFHDGISSKVAFFPPPMTFGLCWVGNTNACIFSSGEKKNIGKICKSIVMISFVCLFPTLPTLRQMYHFRVEKCSSNSCLEHPTCEQASIKHILS